jgi:hypothetical protein
MKRAFHTWPATSRSRPATNTRRGLTLVELVLAAGLLALLLAAVFKLLDQFMGVWEKAEVRRMEVEQSSGISELLASDLDALEPGPRGDLLAEWVMYDVDGDGTNDTKWPRLRLVRHASDAELARLQAGEEHKLVGEGLIEVAWAVTPAYPGTRNLDERALGLLWRGERVYGPARGADLSLFDSKSYGVGGRPRVGAAHAVTSGVLWFGLTFATTTSDLRTGWKLGVGVEHCPANWDAWTRGRPDADRHAWNDASAYVPKAAQTPVLPRRVRLELELESPADFKRRTRLSRFCGPQEGVLEVDNSERLPAPGGHVLLNGEWMELVSVTGGTVSVRRAQRGTKAAHHDSGSLVHYGRMLVREVPIAQHRGEWGL